MDMGESLKNLGFLEIKKPRSKNLMKKPLRFWEKARVKFWFYY